MLQCQARELPAVYLRTPVIMLHSVSHFIYLISLSPATYHGLIDYTTKARVGRSTPTPKSKATVPNLKDQLNDCACRDPRVLPIVHKPPFENYQVLDSFAIVLRRCCSFKVSALIDSSSLRQRERSTTAQQSGPVQCVPSLENRDPSQGTRTYLRTYTTIHHSSLLHRRQTSPTLRRHRLELGRPTQHA
jgi:hypothetical protein